MSAAPRPPLRTGRASPAPAGLAAWLDMLHALGEAAWIVEARGLTLAGINRVALELLGLDEGGARQLGASALIGTPEDLAFWSDVKAGHGGTLQSLASAPMPSPSINCVARFNPAPVYSRAELRLPWTGG